MVDLELPDGLILTDVFRADCGCVFGSIDPHSLGLASEPGEAALVCLPCSLICPNYTFLREEAGRQGKPTHTQVRRAP